MRPGAKDCKCPCHHNPGQFHVEPCCMPDEDEGPVASAPVAPKPGPKPGPKPEPKAEPAKQAHLEEKPAAGPKAK